MLQESCRSEIRHQESYRLPKVDRSTASSRSKSVPVKRGAKIVKHWWERSEFSQNFISCKRESPCKNCQKYNEHQLDLLKARRKFPPHRRVIKDFAHLYAKLKLPSDELPEAKSSLCKEIVPGSRLYHGIQASDVTSYLKKPPPSHCFLAPDAPVEWFGLKCSDVTRIQDTALKGPRPPSREYFFGVQATDVTQNKRIIPPSGPSANDEEPREFFGRSKSDITNFGLFPERIPDGDCREETLCPLGKARLPSPRDCRSSLQPPDRSLLTNNRCYNPKSWAIARPEKQIICRHQPSCIPCQDYNRALGFDPNPQFDTTCGYILSPPVAVRN